MSTNPNEPIDIVLTPVTGVDGSSVTAPSPSDIATQPIQNKVNIPSVAAPAAVDFRPVSTADEVNDESLNRTAKTLRDDVNAKLTSFSNSVSLILGQLGTEHSLQVAEINSKMAALRDAINAELATIRTENEQQNADMATAINQRLSVVMTNLTTLSSAIKNSQAKIAALDATYATDSDIAAKVATINAALEQLNNTDTDVLQQMQETVNLVNSMRKVKEKVITISSTSGTYDFLTVHEGMGAYPLATDYMAAAVVEGNPSVEAYITKKLAVGFTIELKSKGVHFRPQPHDASVNPVTVRVTLTTTQG
ncbi:chemotaxis protein [Vibrio anguillarum]|uniref:chemotaxis protein n=1 Tax=Vibrio anguillarum TaxID=55601 RepID=UPI00097E1C39|nr:chemotaxis protein [Vibrio anguillarum]MBT2909702.1 chemotaxis protein [Vibrio anguillarum]MBT2942447.1 chemotaxis protein [Vibrio anguillarum]MBT2950729.1 chemotaxis protein [Vibrio anguillarum]